MLPVLTHSVPTRRSSDLHQMVRAALLRMRKPFEQPAADERDRGPAYRHLVHPRALADLALRDPPGFRDHRDKPPFGNREPEQRAIGARSEEHTSELQSLMRISYAVFCLQKKNTNKHKTHNQNYKTIYTKKHQYTNIS